MKIFYCSLALVFGVSSSLYAAQRQEEPCKRQKIAAKEKAEDHLEFEFERKSRLGQEEISKTVASFPQDLVGLINDYHDIPQSPLMRHLMMFPQELQNLIAQYAINPAYYMPAIYRKKMCEIDTEEPDRISCNKNGLIAAAGKVFDARFKVTAEIMGDATEIDTRCLIVLRDDDTMIIAQSKSCADVEKTETGYVTAKIHARDGAFLRELKGHTDFISSIAIGSDGSIVTGSWDKTACLWDAHGNLLYRYGASNKVTAVALGKDDLMIIGQEDGIVAVIKCSGQRQDEHILKAHKASITSIVVQDDQTIVTVSDDGVFAWKLDESRWHGVACKQSDEKITTSFVSKNGIILTGCDQNNLRIWDNDGILKKVITIKPLAMYYAIPHLDTIHSIYMNDDGVIIVAVKNSGFFIINADFSLQAIYPVHWGNYDPIAAIHNNGAIIVSSSDDESRSMQFGLKVLKINQSSLKALCQLSLAQLHKLLFVLDELNMQRTADYRHCCDHGYVEHENRFSDFNIVRILRNEQKEFLTTLPKILQENIYRYYKCSPCAEDVLKYDYEFGRFAQEYFDAPDKQRLEIKAALQQEVTDKKLALRSLSPVVLDQLRQLLTELQTIRSAEIENLNDQEADNVRYKNLPALPITIEMMAVLQQLPVVLQKRIVDYFNLKMMKASGSAHEMRDAVEMVSKKRKDC